MKYATTFSQKISQLLADVLIKKGFYTINIPKYIFSFIKFMQLSENVTEISLSLKHFSATYTDKWYTWIWYVCMFANSNVLQQSVWSTCCQYNYVSKTMISAQLFLFMYVYVKQKKNRSLSPLTLVRESRLRHTKHITDSTLEDWSGNR